MSVKKISCALAVAALFLTPAAPKALAQGSCSTQGLSSQLLKLEQTLKATNTYVTGCSQSDLLAMLCGDSNTQAAACVNSDTLAKLCSDSTLLSQLCAQPDIMSKFVSITSSCPQANADTPSTQRPANTPSPTTSATPAPMTSATPKATATTAATPSATPVPTSTAPSSSSASSQVQSMINMINTERRNAGLSELQYDAQLSAEALKHSQDMSQNNYFSHTSPTYGTFAERLKASGISYSWAGENIALYGSVEKAHAALMASEGHRNNIMKATANRVGIGIVWNQAKNGYYITQWFATR